MRKGKILTAMAVILAMMLPVCMCVAEGTLPPSPEPPAADAERQTPAPTAVPVEMLIDQIHSPEKYPGFSFRKDRKLLEIWFPNIKDADEAVLMYDGCVWMIDCGDERTGVRGAQLLRQLGIRKVDILFNTHPHHDHIDGLATTHEAAQIGEVRICFAPVLTASGLRLIQTAEELGIPLKEYDDGSRFSMGDGAVEILVMKNNEEYLDMNNQSAQIRITYGERSILFMADMEKPGQEAMINRIGPELLKCDIVKYPHHGKSEMYEPFFEATEAKLAVVTAYEGRSDAGQYFLSNRGLPAIFTAVNDRFTHLVTDGEYWLCEQVPVTVR